MSAADTEKGDLRSLDVRAKGADVVATGTSGDQGDWDFDAALRERVLAGDPLAVQCAYLLGLWHDGLGEDECTQAEEGQEPCGACYLCHTRAAARVYWEWWDQRRDADAVLRAVGESGSDPSKGRLPSSAEPESAERSPDPKHKGGES